MSTTVVPVPAPAPLSLADYLKPAVSPYHEFIRQHDHELRVAVPGIIQTFDATAQTASVQVAITDRINIYTTGQNGAVLMQQQEKQIPVLADVPVLFPRGGGFSITFPVVAGTACILLFQDSCIDYHWQSGGVQSTNCVARRHDLSDAVAILADITQPHALASVSADSMQMRTDDGATFIDLKSGQITLQANTLTLNGQQVNVTGTAGVTIAGDANTKIEGREFLTHEHTGVSTGAGVSGPVL
jgi:phage baseplate assembly protein gpV